MPDKASGWMGLAERNPIANFIDINLRGAGQVIFQSNPLSGVLFITAVLWGAAMAGAAQIAIGAIIALVIATVTAMVLDADTASLKQGLFGFNGILVGAAVPTFLADGPSMWVLLVIGAAVSTVVMLAVSNVMKTWRTPALTFPFVLTTWFLMLAAYSFDTVTIAGMDPPALAQSAAGAATTDLGVFSLPVIEAWLKGPAQVFLINNWISGVLVVIGLAVSSLWAAGFALAGSAVAVLLAMALGAGSNDISAGLCGFSPVLTAVALGCTFYQPSLRVALYALLATFFTVIVQAAMDAAFTPIGIPTFTAPFVFVTWLFLLPKSDLKPHPHEPIENGILKKVKK
jgi:urea transporter